ncbi:MAG: RNase P subunit p30 family protein [Promethearchaeota archaeon]
MGRFIDFNVKITQRSNLEKTLKLASLLGYSDIVIETSLKLAEFPEIDSTLPHFSRRLTLQETNIQTLRKRLRRERYKYEIISLDCQENKSTKWAAQDNRIDTLVFHASKSLKLFDFSLARLATTFLKAVELPLVPLIKKSFRERIGLIRGYYRVVKIAQKANCPIILSSGANSLLELRAPRDMACFGEVFGFTEKAALESLSSIPEWFLERNKKKLGPNFVAPGIWIDEEEE